MSDLNFGLPTPDRMTTFRYRMIWGVENTQAVVGEITVKTGIYQFAALAIPAMTGQTELPMVIRIWVPQLLPHYKGFSYLLHDDEFGCVAMRLLIVTPDPPYQDEITVEKRDLPPLLRKYKK